MSKAWIAFPLVAVALVGCKSSETEPVSQVPPPAYSAQPEPLAPVSINQGSPGGIDPLTDPGYASGPGTYQPEPLPAQPASRTYTIRKGDTLWSIAQREYGNCLLYTSDAADDPTLVEVAGGGGG